MGKARADADITAVMSGLGLKVESRPLEALIPYAKNARTHSDEQIALIADRFGASASPIRF